MHAIHSLLTGIKDELFCLTVNNQMVGWLVGFYRPFSAQIWLYQRRKVRDGKLSVPSEGRL